MFTFLLWCLLLFICWPLALLALVLYPIFWLLTPPCRIVGIAVDGVLELIKAIIILAGASARWASATSKLVGPNNGQSKTEVAFCKNSYDVPALDREEARLINRPARAAKPKGTRTAPATRWNIA